MFFGQVFIWIQAIYIVIQQQLLFITILDAALIS